MGSDDATDPELIGRALAGEAQAWEALVRRYRRLVFAVPCKMGLRREDAEEVFQDSFLTLLEKLSTLRDRERLAAWLAVTAQRKALMLVSRGAAIREADLPAGLDRPDLRDLPLDELLRLERGNLVQAALERLPERCRRLLEALYFETPTPSYRDLAHRLGVAEGSLGPTRLRCFDKLRKLLEGPGGVFPP